MYLSNKWEYKNARNIINGIPIPFIISDIDILVLIILFGYLVLLEYIFSSIWL